MKHNEHKTYRLSLVSSPDNSRPPIFSLFGTPQVLPKLSYPLISFTGSPYTYAKAAI
jgi:hypothetical protein